MSEDVINMQFKDKILNKLMCGNRAVESTNPDEHGIDEPGKHITQSNFLDQDPWVDEEIPDDPEADEDDDTYTQLQILLKRIQHDD